MRPYANQTAEILRQVAASMRAERSEEGIPTEDALHPLLVERAEKKALFLVLSSDRGLCGAFNTNILKAVEREWKARLANGHQVAFATIGKKGTDFLNRKSAPIVRDFERLYENLDLSRARLVCEWLIPRYLKEEWDAVYLIHNEFKSAIAQKVLFHRLLPLPVSELDQANEIDYLFEPDRKALLEQLVPMYIEISIYQALLESQASEHGARMTAMDAATRNAKEMIGKLTLLYNRARQAAITKELMEIIGGAEALKG